MEEEEIQTTEKASVLHIRIVQIQDIHLRQRA